MKPTIVILPTLSQLRAASHTRDDPAMNEMCSRIKGAIRDYYDGFHDGREARRKILRALTEYK